MSTPDTSALVLPALLDRLEALARKTELGPWHAADVLWRPPVVSRPAAEFIAACSPSTILALLTAARRGAETMQQQDQG